MGSEESRAIRPNETILILHRLFPKMLNHSPFFVKRFFLISSGAKVIRSEKAGRGARKPGHNIFYESASTIIKTLASVSFFLASATRRNIQAARMRVVWPRRWRQAFEVNAMAFFIPLPRSASLMGFKNQTPIGGTTGGGLISITCRRFDLFVLSGR